MRSLTGLLEPRGCNATNAVARSRPTRTSATVTGQPRPDEVVAWLPFVRQRSRATALWTSRARLLRTPGGSSSPRAALTIPATVLAARTSLVGIRAVRSYRAEQVARRTRLDARGIAKRGVPSPTGCTCWPGSIALSCKFVEVHGVELGGSAMASMAAMRCWRMVKPRTATGLPSGVMTRPGVPLTSAGRANCAIARAKVIASCAAAAAPIIGSRAGGATPPPSTRKTTAGSRTAMSASKSPARAAARNASTSSRWREMSVCASGATFWTRRRGRLAS